MKKMLKLRVLFSVLTLFCGSSILHSFVEAEKEEHSALHDFVNQYLKKCRQLQDTCSRFSDKECAIATEDMYETGRKMMIAAGKEIAAAMEEDAVMLGGENVNNAMNMYWSSINAFIQGIKARPLCYLRKDDTELNAAIRLWSVHYQSSHCVADFNFEQQKLEMKIFDKQTELSNIQQELSSLEESLATLSKKREEDHKKHEKEVSDVLEALVAAK